MFYPAKTVAPLLQAHHYLGPSRRGFAYQNAAGALVFANPNSRRLPQHAWLELLRWCLVDAERNAGSQQWSAVVAVLRSEMPTITTVVSYSDPSAGHTGALYRSSNWLWAPTWHRLRPPPTGNGDWGSGAQAAKDRWVFCLQPDPARESLLALRDSGLKKRYPWAEYREPRWKRGVPSGGGGDFKRAIAEKVVQLTSQSAEE